MSGKITGSCTSCSKTREGVEERREVQHMPEEIRPGGASSQPEPGPGGTEEMQVAKNQDEPMSEQEAVSSNARIPAMLPPGSQAAIVQRLNDVPAKPITGFTYDVSQLRLHPASWRTKRHMKRKILRKHFIRATAGERRSA